MAQATATATKKKSTAAKKTGTTAKTKKSKINFNQQEHEIAAYFNWLNRGAPVGDDQHDWFSVAQ